MDELLERLVDLYSQRRIEFFSEEGHIARALAAQQPDLYATLAHIFSSVSFMSSSGQATVGTEHFYNQVFEHAHAYSKDTRPTMNSNGGKIVIESNLPLLTDDKVQSLRDFVVSIKKIERTSAEAKQFGKLAASALIAESEISEIIQSVESGGVYRTQCYIAMATYLAAKQSVSVERQVKIAVSEDVASLNGQLDNFRAEFDGTREKVRIELDTLAAAAKDIESRQSAFLDHVKENHEASRATIHENTQSFGDGMRQVREQLQNFEATVREEMKLESIRLSWESRFGEARWAFRIACGLLLLYLGVTIGSAYVFGLPIVKALANIEQTAASTVPTASSAEPISTPAPSNPVAIPREESVAIAIIHQFGRLIVFSVPVFVWLWAGRALMRYFMRSMLLMDDARQRQTMLDTYFLLSDKGRADERDRPLVLWALFRQTPGHGPDGIEPPDFTEVINAGLKRANAAAGA